MKKLFKIAICLLTLVMLFTMVMPASAAATRHQVEAQYTNTPPVLDGVITEAEWGTPFVNASYTDSKFYYSSTIDTNVLPTNIKFYVRWDLTNLYIGAQITDLKHANPHTGKDIWYADSLEIDICASDNNQAARWRTNTGLSTVDNNAYGYVYNKPNNSLDGVAGTGSNPPDRVNGGSAGTSVITHKDTVTTYELTFPWEYYAKSAKIKNGYAVLINFQLFLADGSLAPDGTSFPNTTYLGSISYGVRDGESILYPVVTLAGADPSVFTTAATTAATTKATTVATTKATTAAATTAGTTVAATTVKEEGGCGSTVGVGVVAIAAITCGAVVSKKRKRK